MAVIPLLAVLLTLAVSALSSLHPGSIAYVEHKTSGHFPEVLATDGTVHIRVTGSLRGPLSCVLSHDKSAVSALLSNSDVVFKTIGKDAVEEMVRRCKELYNAENRKRSGNKRTFNPGAVSFPHEPFPAEKTGQPTGTKSSLLIFPGTKWCGESNIASSYENLGKHAATDSCCRTHDQCPYFVSAFKTKYNTRNPFPWTVSLCDCDRSLYHCLRGVNNTAANGVGISFFGLLDVDCFTFKTGAYCAKYHWAHLWCDKKAIGPEAILQKLGLHW